MLMFRVKLFSISSIVRLSILYTLFITFKWSFFESWKCSLRGFGGVLQSFFLYMYVSTTYHIWYLYMIFFFISYIVLLIPQQILTDCKIMFSFILYITCTFSYVSIQSECSKFFRFLKVMKHLIFSSSHKTIQPVISGLYFFFLFVSYITTY